MKLNFTFTTRHGISFSKAGVINGPAHNTSTSGAFGKRGQLVVVIMLLSIFGFQHICFSQNCPSVGTTSLSVNPNTYFPGTSASVAAGSTSITVGAAGTGTNFGSTAIASGDLVLIIQMQGAEITYTNNATYGDGTNKGAGYLNNSNLVAGNMEFAVATNAVPTSGGTLNLLSGLTNSYYNTNYSSTTQLGQFRYQVIRVGSFYNVKLTGTISTPLWNGTTGGVTIINAVNQIDFNSQTINASGAGFRGGAGRSLSGASGTANTDYLTSASVNANASKGEGIAGTPRYLNNNGTLLDNTVEGYPNGSYGRGAPGTAGGGATDSHPSGNDDNAGGGGGGNGGIGGIGGNGWSANLPTGGRGARLFAQVTPARFVLGGGGGAGDTNNGTGTPGSGFASSGAAGGGIVIISAMSILNSGTINVTGANANNTVLNDASGGGGAGGSVLIYANSGHSGVTVLANGGNGGSNLPGGTPEPQRHGPGGGGGGGVIYSNGTLNASSTASGGLGGTSNLLSFGQADGNNGLLSQSITSSQLPVNMQLCQLNVILATGMTSFTVNYDGNNSVLNWNTPINNTHGFVVESSTNGVQFSAIGSVQSDLTGTGSAYHFTDYSPKSNSGSVFYRIKMVDNTGQTIYSNVVSIHVERDLSGVQLYPNPVHDHATLKITNPDAAVATVKILDNSGRTMSSQLININAGTSNISLDHLSNLSRGVYFVQVIIDGKIQNEKLVKE